MGNGGFYTSAHVLLNLLNELRKRDKMPGLTSILSLFRNKFILDKIYYRTFKIPSKSHFGRKTSSFAIAYAML